MKPVAADRLPRKEATETNNFSSAVRRRCSALQGRKVQQLQINTIIHSCNIHAFFSFFLQSCCSRALKFTGHVHRRQSNGVFLTVQDEL